MSTAIKLDFSKVGLCGRSDELKVLTDAFEETLLESHRGKLGVMIRGAAGTGKTALLAEFEKSVEGRCFFCRGKYEKESSAEGPFAAIVGCLTELVDCLVRDDADLWRTRIKEELNAECYMIARLVDRFRDLVGGDGKCACSRRDGVACNNLAFDRMRVAISSFLKFVCSFHPVVFVTEDVHWSSCECQRLMSVGAAECQNCRRYLFVGTSREATPELEAAIANNKSITLREIRLSNLSMDNVSEMIEGLLRRDREDVEPLAEAVHQRTCGNPFFCVQFVQNLEARKFVYYSTGSFRWEWDMDRILSETDISDNVVECVMGKIKTLPKDAQVALMRAASLGPSKFDLDTLFCAIQAAEQSNEAWDGETKEETKEEEKKEGCFIACDPSELERVLEVVVSEGLVEKLAIPKNYKFSHDRIHEGAYALVPEGDQKKRLHLSIGMKMRSQLLLVPEEKRGTIVEQQLLLLVVHQLNQGYDLVGDCNARVHLAALNLEAADLAMKMVALVPSLEYLRVASVLLGSCWKKNYAMMIELYTKMAKTYLCTGQYSECKTAVDAVLQNAQTFKDKLDAYLVFVKCLALQNRFDEAFSVIFEVLGELGQPHLERTPAQYHIMQACLRLKWALRGKTDEDLLSLSECKDEDIVNRVIFLSELIHLGAMSHRREYLMLGNLHVLLLTLKYGSFQCTGTAVTIYGIRKFMLGRCEDAYRFGTIGLRVAQRGQAGFHDGLCQLMHHWVLHHWKNPYHDSLEPVLRSYQLFAQSTEADFSYMDLAMTIYAKLYLCCGLSLKPLEVDLRKFTELMAEIGQNTELALYRPWFQLVLNLMGRADDPRVLQGEALNKGQYDELTGSLGDCFKAELAQCRIILAHTLGDEITLGELLNKKVKDPTPYMDGISPKMLLIEGLYATSMARKTGKGKYRRWAKSILNKFQAFVQHGAVNCHHMWKLLTAVQYGARDDKERVQAAFDDAIAAAAKLGFVNTHGLANELAAVFFIERDDRYWATTYLTRCRELYADLGAKAKVARLENKYSWCFEGSSVEGSLSSSLKARPRMDELEQEIERRQNRLSMFGRHSGSKR